MASDIRMSEMDGLTLLLHQETVRLMPGAAPLVEGAARVPVLPAVQWVSCGWHRRAGRHCLREEARRIGACRGIIVSCRTEATT